MITSSDNNELIPYSIGLSTQQLLSNKTHMSWFKQSKHGEGCTKGLGIIVYEKKSSRPLGMLFLSSSDMGMTLVRI